MHWSPNSSALCADDVGIVHRRRVQRHLVGAGAQHPPHVFDVANSPADGEGNEHLLGDALDNVHHRVAVVGRGGDVEEHELVGTFGVIARRELDGVPRVADLDESHTLHHATGVDIEARDHSDGEHAAIPSSIVKRFS